MIDERLELPPPNWSPTGNSGAWRWDEKYVHKVRGGEEPRGAWRWHDDVYGLMSRKDFNKLNATRSCATRKNFLTKVKNFFKIKK